VSGGCHGGWRERPSVSLHERTGVRRRLRRTAAPCGSPVTPLACVVVKPVTTVTKRYIDDRLGKRFAIGWVPDTIVFMNAVPKASVGKFDKCAAAS
jgi:acyl-CoA synthetase (AMP-forming)/AMP-acid ligase II